MGFGKQLLIFALESQAIARFSVIASRLGFDVDCHYRARDFQSNVGRLIGISDHLAGWISRVKESADEFDVVYLRSSAIYLIELFHQSLANVDAVQTYHCRTLLYFDLVLRNYATVSVEELYGPAALDRVAEVLVSKAVVNSLPLPPSDEIKRHDLGYSASAAQLLFGPRAPLTVRDWPLLEVGSVCSIGACTFASVLLEWGWNSPEVTHVWSKAASASLLLPICGTHGATRCQLIGIVVPGDFSINAYVAGNLVCSVLKPAEDRTRDVVLDFPLPMAANDDARVIRVALDLQGTICLKKLGIGEDPRDLGFALHSIRIYAELNLDTDVAPRAVGRNPSGIAMVMVKPTGEDAVEAFEFCVLQGYSLVLPVWNSEDTKWQSERMPAGCGLLPSCRNLHEAFGRLPHISHRLETIVIWDIEGSTAAANSLATLLANHPEWNVDLVIKTDDIAAIEPLQPWLQDHSRVVSYSAGLIHMRAHSPSDLLRI